ncbi:MAG: carbonic anhydrase [Porticoccaceae bacterium]|nr:carbonic anhydrase [Porticoccaceae bacterium]
MKDNSGCSENLSALIKANQNYSKSFDQSQLKPAPTKHFAILTCMDCRMDPYKFAGLKDGEAHIIRNAGGRATEDAIRSLIISHKFLGTLEWFVIHHTNCGMSMIADQVIGELLADDLETAEFDGQQWSNPQRDHSHNTKPGSDLGKTICWHTFTDLRASVLNDVELIANHPLVSSHIKVYGFIFDIKTGKLTPVNA